MAEQQDEKIVIVISKYYDRWKQKYPDADINSFRSHLHSNIDMFLRENGC